jgi:hypothetical protein
MHRVWADRLFCFGASATLLLLTAAEGKVWPWLLEPVVAKQSEDEAAAVEDVSSPDDAPVAEPPEGQQEPREASTVCIVLPDGVPVRSPLSVARQAWATARGSSAGIVAAGPLTPLRHVLPPAACEVWPLWQLRPRCAAPLAPTRHVTSVRLNPSIGTVQLRTGPPRA